MSDTNFAVKELERIDNAKAFKPQNKKPNFDHCMIFKREKCMPKRIQFKECLTCANCSAMTLEVALPSLFKRIISIASMFMSIFELRNKLFRKKID